MLMCVRTQSRNKDFRLKYKTLQSLNIYIKKNVKMYKIGHLHTARAIGIPRKRYPRCGYPREQTKLHWSGMHVGGSEFRSSGSGAVLLTTPFAEHPNPFGGQFPAPHPKSGV